MKVKIIKGSVNPHNWYNNIQLPYECEVKFSGALYEVVSGDFKGHFIAPEHCQELTTCELHKGATKYDEGKPSFSSLPQLALLEVAKGFTHGREKYGLFNYSKSMEILRYIDAADRHKHKFLTYHDFNDIDESGVHHLALMVANGLMALDAILTGQAIDNRNNIYKNNGIKD